MIRPLLALWLAAGVAPVRAEAQAAPAEVEVAVLGASVAKGTLLSAADFVREPRSAAEARGAIAENDAIGMEAARNLAGGAVVRRGDLMRPQLVRRGEPVTISIRSGALTIAATGRALGSGASGDLVRVVSLSTNRTLDGVVEGPGAIGILQ